MNKDLGTRRSQLHDLNTRAWNGEAVFPVAPKPDSSLKKNTTFIKKVRISINHEQHASILQDIKNVSLGKYLSEIIAAVSEGLRKVNKNDDITAAMEVVSALHQRFSVQFTPFLLTNMLTALSTKQNGELVSQEIYDTRIKSQFKLLVEFHCIGILRTLKDCDKEMIPEPILASFGKLASQPISIVVLKDLLNYEFKNGGSLSVALSFIKRFSFLLDAKDAEPNFQELLTRILQRYTEAVFDRTSALAKSVKSLEMRNQKASIRTGKFLDEIVTELDQTTKVFEQFKSASGVLGEALHLEIPEFTEALEAGENAESVVEVVKSKSGNEDELDGIWEDLRQKNFYTKISSLAEIEENLGETTLNKISNKTDSEKINMFMNELEVVDETTLEPLVHLFNKMDINNKATKNRILRFITENPDINSSRYYVKFLKYNEDTLHELIEELTEYLDKGFRGQIYHNSVSFRYIYLFVEMIRFKLIPSHVIFHKIRTLTIRFSEPGAMDLLSILYERVGRFLLHEPEYKDLMREMVESLKEKQKKTPRINDKLAISNLLMMIDPPVVKVKEEKKITYTPVQQFVYRLVRVELNDKTLRTIIGVFRDLKLESKDLLGVVLDCFTHPELTNYGNISSLAKLIPVTAPYRSLRVRILDGLIENIKRGLELNDFRSNRTRMAQVKYMSELCIEGLVSFKTVVELMYKIICSGHPNNQPLPRSEVSSDPSDNYFRVQMCCMMLLSLKELLHEPKKKGRKKLHPNKIEVNKELLKVFLVFFQYYVFCKDAPIPMDIEFQLSDVFVEYGEITERYNTFKETIAKLQEVVRKRDTEGSQIGEGAEEGVAENEDEEEADIEEEEEEDSGDEDDDNEEEGDDDFNDNESDDDEEDSEDDESDEASESDDDDSYSEFDAEDLDSESPRRLTEKDRLQLAADKKFEDDMERDFQRMVSESYESSRGAAHSGKKLNMPSISQHIRNEQPVAQESKISFSFLTKSGKKTSAKNVHIPSDTGFAASLMKAKADQKQDKARIMSLVYDMK